MPLVLSMTIPAAVRSRSDFAMPCASWIRPAASMLSTRSSSRCLRTLLSARSQKIVDGYVVEEPIVAPDSRICAFFNLCWLCSSYVRDAVFPVWSQISKDLLIFRRSKGCHRLAITGSTSRSFASISEVGASRMGNFSLEPASLPEKASSPSSR